MRSSNPFRWSTWIVFAALALPFAGRAEGEREVEEAIAALARTSYRWETTTRQRFSGETTEPRIDRNAPLEVQAMVEPMGFMQMKFSASRELPAPLTVVFREGDVVAHTPLGWLRRAELRQPPRPDRTVTFEGKEIRLSRFLSAALKATTKRPLAEDLFDLLADLKSFRRVESLVVAELHEQAIERLWGDAQAKRAPEIHGTVLFKLSDQGLAEYHLVLGIGFPNSRTKTIAWSMQQWSTRLSGLGSTTVTPPEGAVRVLDETAN